MKIIYDHQIFDLQEYGGISRYFFELMAAYAEAGGPAFELACPYTTNAYLWEAPFLRLNTPLTRQRYRGSGVVNRLLAKRRNRPAAVAALRQGEFDLFHPTYYDPYFLDHLRGKPFVLTVHDMTHERYPGFYPGDDPTAGWKLLLAKEAAHLVAVSQFTKDEIVTCYGVPEEKVSVIYHGSSLAVESVEIEQAKLPQTYLLYVGERGRYKNFGFAVRSLSPLFRENPDLWLVCAGGGPFDGEEQALLDGLGLHGRTLQAGLKDRELATAYRGAIALVFPSLCEGFGIPVLEAFACGCPALLARRSSLPEVGGEAAIYFDPEEGEELLGQASRLLQDPDLRHSLIAAGRERVKTFTWERTAAETRKVYAQVLKRGQGGGC